MADPDIFGVDLSEVRDRLASLAYFTSAQDIQAAGEAIEGLKPFVPPAAFVSVSNESYDPNKRSTGTPLQRATTTISTLFCVPAQRADGRESDEVEAARKAIFLIYRGWTPPGADMPLEAVSYRVRMIADGLIWGEWQHRTRFLI